MANNNLLYNAALDGYLAGALAGRHLTDNVQADYSLIVVQARVFGIAVDIGIPSDIIGAAQPVGTVPISNVGGSAIVPASSPFAESTLAKPQLLYALCYGNAFQRFSIDPSIQAVFATSAAAIKAAYLQGALSHVNSTGVNAAHNNLLFNAAFNGYLAGALSGGNLIDSVQTDYAPIVNQASLFATAVDAAIPNDAAATPQPAGTKPISLAGAAAIVPDNSSTVEAQKAKTQLLFKLCFGNAFNRYSTDASAQTAFATSAAAIKAAYFEGATFQLNSTP